MLRRQSSAKALMLSRKLGRLFLPRNLRRFTQSQPQVANLQRDLPGQARRSPEISVAVDIFR
jgi:hypothetical protein